MPRSPHRIVVTDQQKALSIDLRRLVRVARSVLAAEEVISSDISLALVDNRRIHQLNRDFLGHDYPTDVLSFSLDDKPGPRRARNKSRAPLPYGAGRQLCGEVIISAECAVAMAAVYGWAPADEIVLYLVHGLLHLCGHNDKSARERRIMRAREAELLRPWGLDPRYKKDESKRFKGEK